MARRSKSKESTEEPLSNPSKEEHAHNQEEEDEEKLEAVALPVGADEDTNAAAAVDATGEELDKDEEFELSPNGCNLFQWIDEMNSKSTEVKRLEKQMVADMEKAKLKLMEIMRELQKLESRLKWHLMFVIGSFLVCIVLVVGVVAHMGVGR